MLSSTAIFACSDIEATIAYYKDVLGFTTSWTYGDPPTFGSASIGGVSLMFCRDPQLAAHIRGHQHWISVEDADEIYRLHRANGAVIVADIEDKPWNIREYTVEDLNGYHLRFTGPTAQKAPRSEPLPDGVTFERRKPTAEEYTAIAGKAFGSAREPSALDHTWHGVVARSPAGQTIAVLRIMRDSNGWFSIWDVAVTPDWQAKGVGTKMMREALELIKAARESSIVYLFTYKPDFYERLGFKEEKVSVRRI